MAAGTRGSGSTRRPGCCTGAPRPARTGRRLGTDAMPRKPPPTTGELLLRAVFEHPEDDAPRLAYADWLDEFGGEPERAALIRVQCEHERLPADDPRRAVLERQAASLLRGR